MKIVLFRRFAFLAAFAACVASFAKEERPNIIMIGIDDLNDWVGVYGGHPQAKTPNIDRFAEQAMVFRNASCPGPVCGPSRSALLSGFMPSTTGLYGNENNMLDAPLVQEHATLPEYFSKHGYMTLSKGKIFHKHMTSRGVDHGHWAFDVWEKESGEDRVNDVTLYSRHEGIINGVKVEGAQDERKGVDLRWGATVAPKESTKDYQTAKWFADKLQEDFDKPFFMSVGISKPHLPFIVPQEYFDLYDTERVKTPEYRVDDLDDIVDSRGKKMFEPHPDFEWCLEHGILKEAVRAYLAATSYADDCVGVVLDALAESKYRDHTIVILWGDHGWHLGEKLKFRKGSLWRESTQLPFIVRLPEMDGGQECYRNVNLIDLYPTLVDLCDLPEKKELDGTSIVPLLRDPGFKWKPTITTRGPGSHSVMGERWHYIVYANGAEELYDLKKDPMEWTNLAQASSPNAKKAAKRLSAYLPSAEAREVKPGEKNRSVRELDETIKPQRVLSQLK